MGAHDTSDPARTTAEAKAAAAASLTKVTDGGAAKDRAWEDDRGETLLFFVAAVLLTAIYAGSYLITDQLAGTFLAELSTTREAFVRVRGREAGGLVLLVALPQVALYLSLSSQRGPAVWLPEGWLPPVRRVALAAAAAMTALCTTWLWLSDGRDGSVAEASGVTWYENGRPTGQASWSDATEIEAACTMEPRRRRGWRERLVPSFRYGVTFADGRSVELARDEDLAYDWPQRIAPIDAALRAAGVSRAGGIEATCLEETYRTSRADPETLRRVLAP